MLQSFLLKNRKYRTLLQPRTTHFWNGLKNMESFFTASTKIQVTNGTSARFWVDCWNDQSFVTMFATLHSYTERPEIFVAEAMESNQWELLSQTTIIITGTKSIAANDTKVGTSAINRGTNR
jgi:hypothetical protein